MLCCTGNDGGVLKVSIKHHTLQTFHYNTVRLLVTCSCYLKCVFLHDRTLKKKNSFVLYDKTFNRVLLFCLYICVFHVWKDLFMGKYRFISSFQQVHSLMYYLWVSKNITGGYVKRKNALPFRSLGSVRFSYMRIKAGFI